MDQIAQIIQENVVFAPYIIFGTLLLAGLNIPVSEDGMLFITALIAVNNPDQLSALFIAVFAGAYCSDLIAYNLGRYLGPQIWNIKFFAKMINIERVEKLNTYYEKYGPVTLFFGRFIPFGVRNALFISAGLAKMNFKKFAFFDFLACVLSCSTYFYLYYQFGMDVIEYVKKGNVILFSTAIAIILLIVIRIHLQKKNVTQG